MGLIYLPSVDDIVAEKDSKKQMEMLVNTVGILMKELREVNGYMSSKNIFEVGGWKVDNGKLSSTPDVYPYVELNPKGKFLGAYKTEEDALKIFAFDSGTDVPGIQFSSSIPGMLALQYYDPSEPEYVFTANGDIQISASVDMYLFGNQIYANNVPINSMLTSLQSSVSSLQSQINSLDSRVKALGG